MTDTAPPPNFDPLNPDHVREAFRQEIAPLIQRSDELVAAFQRAPEKVEDDQAESRMTTLAKQLGECASAIEAKRKEHKGRYDKCGNEIHGIAKGYSDKLSGDKRNPGLKQEVEKRIGVFQRQKIDAERKRREEEARRAEEAARQKTEALQSEEELDEAVRAEEEAAKARREAAAKPAEMHRARGEYGGVSSARTVLDFQVTDYFLIPPATLWMFIPAEAKEKAVRAYMQTNRDRVKKAVKEGAGDKIVPGVRFFEELDTKVR